MNFQKRMLPWLCLATISLQACQDEMMIDNESQSSEDSYIIRRKQIKLGEKKWALPYSLKNVQAVYDSLSKRNSLRSGGYEQLQATHYYVRFQPKDSSEWAELMKDTNIILSEIPWDRETTMHELAHASHCQSVGLVTYNNCLPQRGMVCCRSLLTLPEENTKS